MPGATQVLIASETATRVYVALWPIEEATIDDRLLENRRGMVRCRNWVLKAEHQTRAPAFPLWERRIFYRDDRTAYRHSER